MPLGPSRSRAIGAALPLALLLTAGCGATTTPQAPDNPTISTTATPTEAPVSPAATGSASPAATSTVKVPAPCEALTKEEAGKATDTTITQTEEKEQNGSKLCVYTAEKTSDPSITSQITPLSGGDIETMMKYLTEQFDSPKVTKLQGPKGEDGRMVTGKLRGADVADVVLVKGDLVYQVLVADTGTDSGKLADMAKAGANAFVA